MHVSLWPEGRIHSRRGGSPRTPKRGQQATQRPTSPHAQENFEPSGQKTLKQNSENGIGPLLCSQQEGVVVLVCGRHKLDRKGWWPFPRACGRACCCDRRNRIEIDACMLSRVVLPRGGVSVLWLTIMSAWTTHKLISLFVARVCVLCPPPSTATHSPRFHAQVAELPWETRCRPFTRPFRTSAR